MLPVTLSTGEDVYLLYYRADWGNGFELRSHLLAKIDRSEGGLSARTPEGETLRSRFVFDLQLYQRESAEFRVALQRLANKRILCPFWPAAHNAYTGVAVYLAPGGEVYTTDDGSLYLGGGGELPWISSGLWLTFEQDWSHWEVHSTELPAGFTPTSTAVRVPLLLGYFEAPPDPPALTDQLIACQIQFLESSPAALALRPVIVPPVYGPALHGEDVPLFPLAPDWASPPSAGGASVETDRGAVGLGRELVSTYYPQDSVRTLSLSYSPDTWTESAALLSFFLSRQGQIGTFWLPGPLSECQLVAPTSGVSAVIQVDEAALLGDNRYLAFIRPGQTPVMRKILSVDTTANTLTLDAAPGVFGIAEVSLVSLILVRFSKPEIGLRFSGGALDSCRLDFIEEPSETYTPTGETFGLTLGALPPVAYLYRFTRHYPGIDVVNRYTSFERDLVFEGETYLARAITHDHAVETITLDDIAATITSDSFTGNPLLMISPFRLEVPLYCEVIECQPLSDGTATGGISRIYGKISKPSIAGNIITAEIGSLLGGLTQNVPTLLLQTDCAVRLFSAPCGVAESAWTITGTVDSITGNVVALSALSMVAGGSLPTITDGFFSYGRLWTGSGETYESRTIYNSAVASGGHVSLVLSHPLNLTPTAPVYFAPGCGGTFTECQNKFSNRNRFRGFPYLPMANPSLVAIKTDPVTPSKK
jgi:hypothetical protein